MPRDGSGIYTRPSPDVISGTTIESTVYNGFTADVALEFNSARPIIAGGTGATTAAGALTALGGEVAGQVVTNYDSHVFKAGSFYSTSAPGQNAPVDGHAFAGVATLQDANNLVVKATDMDDTVTPARTYVRIKDGGVWSSWAADGLVGGGTATGDITIDPAAGNSSLTLDKPTTGDTNVIFGSKQSLNRWSVELGTATAESGGNAGAGFAINRYTDAGAYNGSPLTINRATGNAAFANNVSAAGDITGANLTAGTGSTGTLFFGNSGTKYLQYDATNFVLNGAQLVVSSGGIYAGSGARIAAEGNLYTGVNVATGSVYFGNTNTRYITFDGTNTHFNNMGTTFFDSGTIAINGDAVVGQTNTLQGTLRFGNNGTRYLQCDSSGSYRFNTGDVYTEGGILKPKTSSDIFSTGNHGLEIRSTGSGAEAFCGFHVPSAYAVNFGFSNGGGNNFFMAGWSLGATSYQFWTKKDFNYIPSPSDYRIKKDVIDLPGMWEVVKRLRPIQYKHKDYDLPARAELKQWQMENGWKPDDKMQIEDDGLERWGFMAHELQEALLETAAQGKKDAPDTLQQPDPLTVVAVLTKALQEAMARIEVLEANAKP